MRKIISLHAGMTYLNFLIPEAANSNKKKVLENQSGIVYNQIHQYE